MRIEGLAEGRLRGAIHGSGTVTLEVKAAEGGPTLGARVAFGTGGMSGGVVGQALTAFALLYYNQVIGMSPAAVGLALMVSLIFDAVWDPAIGLWSDNTRSRMGRRHPFMYAAIIPASVAFWLLWSAPTGLSESGNFAWLLSALLAVRFFTSLFEVPSIALATELAPGYNTRTGLLSLRYFWAVLGGVLMSILAYQVFLSDRNGGLTNREGFAGYGLAGAAIIGVSLFIASIGTHRTAARFTPPPLVSRSPAALIGEIRSALTNPNFAVIFIAGLFLGISGGLNTGLNMYFNIYFWNLSTDSLTLLTLAGLVGSVIGISLAPAAARRWGKKPVALTLFGLTVVITNLPMVLRLLGILPGNGWPLLVPLLCAETFVVATMGLMVAVIITSMLADVVEDNAVRSGRRSDGLFFAANSVLSKFVTGIGTFGSGLMLVAVGFPRSAAPGQVEQPVMHALAILYLPASVTLAALAIGSLSFFRIDQAKHEENLLRLRSATLADQEDGEPYLAERRD